MARPRIISLSEEEMEVLGQEMIDWVKKHKPLHLSQWYTIEKGFTYNEWKTFIVKVEFFPYYEQALKIVGIQYLDKNSNVRDGISQRWQRAYFKDLKEIEDQDLDDAAIRSAKASEGQVVDEELLANFKAIMAQLKESQDKYKA